MTEGPSRKKARKVKLEHMGMEIPYWKSLIKEEPLNTDNWDALLLAYQREFDDVTTYEGTHNSGGGSKVLFVLHC